MNFIKRFQLTPTSSTLGGRYKLICQLGVGGFSQTFLAEDVHLPGHPRCVVKQLKPQVKDPSHLQTARRLFDTEAEVLYKLGSHDQIPRLLAHFEENQEFYLVQELIEGNALTQYLISGQPWSAGRVILLLQDILKVLVFVHEQNVIHRDIKPSNLMCRNKDGKIVLIDFGAVKQVSTQLVESSGHSMTISIGTQGYMPLEQLSGAPRFNSDLYAVGMIGIQALTGIHPRHFARDPQTGEVVWYDRLPTLTAKAPDPKVAGLAAILDRMTRSHFKDRYSTADEVLEALNGLLADYPNLAAVVEAASLLEEPDATAVELEASEMLSPTTVLPEGWRSEEILNTSPTGASQAEDQTAPPEAVTAADPEADTEADRSLTATTASVPATEVVSPIHPDFRDRSQSAVKRPATWKLLLGGGLLAVAAAVSIAPLVGIHITGTHSQADILPASLPCSAASTSVPSDTPDYRYPDGTLYYGATQNGLPANGKATMLFPSGNRYSGEFKNGKRNGCGTLVFKNGRQYVGQFKDDQFEGLGTWVLENGDRYIGEFKNNRCDGRGTFLFKNRQSVSGTWQNGKLTGSKLTCDRSH